MNGRIRRQRRAAILAHLHKIWAPADPYQAPADVQEWRNRNHLTPGGNRHV